MDAALTPQEALAPWRDRVGPDPAVRRCDDGLINRTFFVGAPPTHVLQWVNPIFDRRIQLDIAAVTEHLAAVEMTTPRLVATDAGGSLEVDGGGFWRLMTFIPGVTHHRLAGPRMAASVGGLVGRFHAALAEAALPMAAPPRRIHQTSARLEELRTALEACAENHPLASTARRLGDAILGAWDGWQGALDLPERPCHGDLKVSNIRFAPGTGDAAVCLLDLDTLGRQDYAAEMGDAWRSWCNPATEEEPEAARLDVALFEASAVAWLRAAPPLSAEEREGLVPGIERISLELAARFCADAVQNSYFREDLSRFPAVGEHNLARARAQLALARSAREQRGACERCLAGVA